MSCTPLLTLDACLEVLRDLEAHNEVVSAYCSNLNPLVIAKIVETPSHSGRERHDYETTSQLRQLRQGQNGPLYRWWTNCFCCDVKT